MTNVFISWSGERSKRIAEELRTWIPSVLQFAKPYFTPSDIEKGAKWGTEISRNLANTNVGIICLTKENKDKPWILFEAGALSKDLDHSKVCSVLFDMENTDLIGPLATFQTTKFDEVDFKKMMSTINESGGENALPKETFDKVFKMWWPELKVNIDAILDEKIADGKVDERTDRDIMEEILLLSRSLSRSSRSQKHLNPPRGLLIDLFSAIESIITAQEKNYNGTLNQTMEDLFDVTRYLVGQSGDFREENQEKFEYLIERSKEIVPF
jgi:hypothetical protein